MAHMRSFHRRSVKEVHLAQASDRRAIWLPRVLAIADDVIESTDPLPLLARLRHADHL
jgi:hypothetical protein